MGFAWRICCSRLSTCCEPDAMAARYCITFFVFSVLPAPDSPLVISTREFIERVRDEN